MFSISLATLGSVILVSLISLVGIFTILWKEEELKPFLFVLVSFSAGALFGDVFIHLLPEAISRQGLEPVTAFWILGGILTFLILEKFIHWRHCHLPEDHRHAQPFAITNLVGDGVHNFIDGMIIAGSYLVSLPVGFATTLAVALHEIPQEIGDFGILLHGGFQKKKALWLNFISAATAILGAIIILFIGKGSDALTLYLIPFTVGGFLYIAGADLIPELHKETNPTNSLIQIFSFLAGIFIMYLLIFLE